MNNDVKNILNNLLDSERIDAFTLYKFLKGNVTEVDELINIINSLLKENKVNSSEAFVLIEYLSSLKFDIGLQKPDWQHPYVIEPIYEIKTTPSSSPIWNGDYTVSSQPV